MKKRIQFLFFSTLALFHCAKDNIELYSYEKSMGENIEEAIGSNGVVSSVHPLASDIGINILKVGGNAIDAAIATGLALGVVDQSNCGLGGGAFIVMRLADGTVHTIDGREMAPEKADRNMYIQNGTVNSEISKTGPLAVAVPGVPAAYVKALELAGTLTIKELAQPAINLAKTGFILDQAYLDRYKGAINELRKDSASAAIYFHENNSELAVGDVFKQPLLAETYEKFAERGVAYFYKGDFADRLESFMVQNGGLITKKDMENYQAIERPPIIGNYKDYQIYGMGPPSSGGVHVVQILNMIEASGVLQNKNKWDEESMYFVSQFMNRAFQDRANHLGDGDFYPVPVNRLISKSYAEILVDEITSKAVLAPPIEGFSLNYGQGHTTNFAVVDKWGNAVSINHTVNLTYGAKITVPGTGVILNCEMDDFSVQPGVPNAFGLIGAEANAIEPGKRPLSSMSPTIIVKDDKPILVLGGAGGPRIITAVLHTIIGVLDFNLTIGKALSLPRFHHQYRPDALFIESHISNSHRSAMVKKGYTVINRNGLGTVRAVSWNEKLQTYVGAADPRTRNGEGAKAY